MVTTVVVTSYYTPSPTAPASTSARSPSSKVSPGLATGAVIGGFLLTCVIGFLLFHVWKRRHPHKWPHIPNTALNIRSDAENFPGWRRSTAKRLNEAKDVDLEVETKTDEFSTQKLLRYPVTPDSPPQLPLPIFTGSLSSSESSRTLAVQDHANGFLTEYTAALKWGEGAGEEGAQVARNGSGSSTSDQTRSISLSPPKAVFDLASDSHHVGRGLELVAEPGELLLIDHRSESSHSHHTHHTHYSHHSYQQPYHVHQQRSASEMASYYYGPRPSRSPSPVTYMYPRSTSQQSMYLHQPAPLPPGPALVQSPGPGIGTSASWHGHTMLTMPLGTRKSWHALGHGHASGVTGPPSSWNAGNYVNSNAVSSAPYWTPQPSPIATRFYLPAESAPSTPVMPSFPPAPDSPRPLTPPRKLTCTNPDETRSLAESSRKSRPATPEP